MARNAQIAAWRGQPGDTRPDAIAPLSIPPASGRMFAHGRLRKQWRYIAVHDERVQVCAATIAIGPTRTTFWSIWDRERGELHEATHKLNRGVETPAGRLLIDDAGVSASFEFEESPMVETFTPQGRSAWSWTGKQCGITARGRITVGGRTIELEAPAIVDDSAGYHDRHTDWRWCSGVGTLTDGRAVAWNFANGVHDTPGASEQTIWVEGVPHQVDPMLIATDLSNVRFADDSRLYFHEEATRNHAESIGLISSRYSQPFGRFSGVLPGVGSLAKGLGVMESHSVVW